MLNQDIPYKLNISKRARRMRISVACDSSVVLTVPMGFNLGAAEKFFLEKVSWIKKTLTKFEPFKNRPIIKSGRREYLKYRAQAKALAQAKVRQVNQFYNFQHGRISIKNQKTRWGSCSKKGNLNFNYKIVHLPEPLLDYLVAHELCHLKEFNHSRNFWLLVSKTVPDFRLRRRELKTILG